MYKHNIRISQNYIKRIHILIICSVIRNQVAHLDITRIFVPLMVWVDSVLKQTLHRVLGALENKHISRSVSDFQSFHSHCFKILYGPLQKSWNLMGNLPFLHYSQCLLELTKISQGVSLYLYLKLPCSYYFYELETPLKRTQ